MLFRIVLTYKHGLRHGDDLQSAQHVRQNLQTIKIQEIGFKGTVSRDFRLLICFMNQFPPSPWVHHQGRNGPNRILWSWGKTDSWKKPEAKSLVTLSLKTSAKKWGENNYLGYHGGAQAPSVLHRAVACLQDGLHAQVDILRTTLLATTFFLWYKEYCFLEKMAPVFSYPGSHLCCFNASYQFDVASALYFLVKNTQVEIWPSYCQLSKSPPAQPYCQLPRLPPILRICQIPVAVTSATYSIASCQGCRFNLPHLNASYTDCHVAYLFAISPSPLTLLPATLLPRCILGYNLPYHANASYTQFATWHTWLQYILPYCQQPRLPSALSSVHRGPQWLDTLGALPPSHWKQKAREKETIYSKVAALFPVKTDKNNVKI